MRAGQDNSDAYCVEPAGSGDLPGILDILNHHILTHHCVFDTEPWSLKQKEAWFDAFATDGPYRLLVARAGHDILGYAHSSRWRPKSAYDVTAETTVYVSTDYQSGGIGRALMQKLLHGLPGTGLHSAVAGIAQPGPASNRLHESLGFKKIGTYRQVGYKFKRFWDVRWYQKSLVEQS